MINNVTLVGRLTKDPELRITPSGVPVASFTLAVNRPFKNANNETEADFISCQVWRKPAENAANYLKKGSLAGVIGRIQTRHYDGSDGKRVYVTEVLAESVQFLEPKREGSGAAAAAQNIQNHNNGNQSNYGAGNQGGYQQQSQQQRQPDPFANSGQINISDDDLPF